MWLSIPVSFTKFQVPISCGTIDDDASFNAVLPSDLRYYYYEEAIRLKPDHASAWNDKGYALINLGRYEDALLSLEEAIRLKPDHASAWYNKRTILGKLNQEGWSYRIVDRTD